MPQSVRRLEIPAATERLEIAAATENAVNPLHSAVSYLSEVVHMQVYQVLQTYGCRRQGTQRIGSSRNTTLISIKTFSRKSS